jgi:glycosidase
MPINTSPSYHGYDVINYFNVNPEYGTFDDFKRLLAEAHKRGIRVIIDLVLNHTSSENPYFVSASASGDSPYHDWYVWSDTSQGDHWYFSGNGEKTQYYYAYFSAQMPDLNYQNPEVTEKMGKVVSFWITDVGVDGFRVDAAKHLIEEDKKLENTQATHDWFRDFYNYYKSLNPNAYVVGEVSGSDARATELYDDDQMDMIFNFEVASGFVNSANGGAISGVGSAISFIQEDSPDWNFATFLTNHDQNRVMSTLSGNVAKAKVAAALLLTSPGTPFIYYGEEIGMMGSKPDISIRRPMQWSGGDDAGFTSGTPWQEFGENWITSNVANEGQDPESLLSWYKTLIHLRQENPALSIGDYHVVTADNRAVYSAIRQYEGKTILVLINLSKSPVEEYSLSWEGIDLADGPYSLASILGSISAERVVVSTGCVAGYTPVHRLEPFQTLMFEINGMN